MTENRWRERLVRWTSIAGVTTPVGIVLRSVLPDNALQWPLALIGCLLISLPIVSWLHPKGPKKEDD